jgi:hypothetical protein
MKIQWKYTEQASQPMADRLGKIVNVAGISTLFQSYFPFIISRSEAKSISTLFQSYFACPPRRVFPPYF